MQAMISKYSQKLIVLLFILFCLFFYVSPILASEEHQTTASVPSTYTEVDRDKNFILYSNGIVLDTKTNLEWVAGPDKNTTYQDAWRWIRNLSIDGRNDWRLPTEEEMRSLYEKGKGSNNMTPLIKTTGAWVWISHIFKLNTTANPAWNLRKGYINRPGQIMLNEPRAFAVRSSVSAIPSSDKQPDKLYTAYNIFVWSRGGMTCLNFKGSPNRIPVGTLVKKGRVWNNSITFEPLEGQYKGYDFSIAYMSHYHKKNKLSDYVNWMFTKKTFDELTKDFSEQEIAAIKRGTLVNGMRKDAVYTCFGPPDDRYTPSLDANTWTYYSNRKRRFDVIFKKNIKTGLYEVVGR